LSIQQLIPTLIQNFEIIQKCQ